MLRSSASGVQDEDDVLCGGRIRFVVLDQRVHEAHKDTCDKRDASRSAFTRRGDAVSTLLATTATTYLQVLEQSLDTRSTFQLVMVVIVLVTFLTNFMGCLRLHDQVHGKHRAANAIGSDSASYGALSTCSFWRDHLELVEE